VSGVLCRSDAPDRVAFDQAFAALPERVREDPWRVGLLPAQVWRGFLDMPAPFPAEFWLAADGAGRVGASVSQVHAGSGYVGFYELDLRRPDWARVSRALLDAATAWLSTQGVVKAFGPVCFNTWFPYRFRTDDHPERFAWEPVNPLEYPASFEANGFGVDTAYKSEANASLEEVARATESAHERALAAGYTFRPLDPARLVEQEIPLLHEISTQAFAGEAYLLEPISLEAFQGLYVPIASKADLSMACFALDPAGAPVGFFFGFPDRSEREAYVVGKSTAVLPRARGNGLSNAMWHLATRRGVDLGIERAIIGMVRVGAQSESYAKKGALLWRHDYALYGKDLEGAAT
jgi:GNAT superfamily N-acetyltransferase